MRRWAAFAVGMTAACSGWQEDEQDGLRHLTGSRVSGSEGYARAAVPVEGEQALLLMITPQDGFLAHVNHIKDSDGSDLFDAPTIWEEPRSVTGGAFADFLSVTNWPPRDSDAGLDDGKWVFQIGTVDSTLSYNTNVEVEVDVLLKDDSDLDSGALTVNIVFAGSTAQDSEVLSAVGEAEEVFADIYESIGIDVTFVEFEYPVEGMSAPGFGGDQDYIDISTQTGTRSVNLVIIGDMAGGEGLYGLAGGIPGPLQATGQSGVAINSIVNSGPDLVYSAGEIRLLGETMAHEVGHFVGLFHPVENTYDLFDGLDDTEECGDEASCASQLGHNLMYWTTVCTEDGQCWVQNDLTDEQRGTMHRAVVVE